MIQAGVCQLPGLSVYRTGQEFFDRWYFWRPFAAVAGYSRREDPQYHLPGLFTDTKYGSSNAAVEGMNAKSSGLSPTPAVITGFPRAESPISFTPYPAGCLS
ncbi:MAG: hypothetical protein ACYDBH_23315 [Acidobacteriaceae bacterium]